MSRSGTAERWAAAAAIGLALAAGGAAHRLARSVTRGVARLDAVAARLADGDFSARAPVDEGPVEVRRLAATLNRAASHLQELAQAQRGFVADASHELRGPLTALRMRVEAMQLAGAGTASLAALSRELLRLTRMVEQLLTLARAEARASEPVPVAVAAVVRERVEAWQPVAAEREVRIESSIGAPLPVVAAAGGALEQMLDNLLANALRVAPAGSAVAVDVRADHDEVRCVIADRGPGMSPEQRRRAFERFWRAPGAPPGGAGLGLAIVAELARASGAVVELGARAGGGLAAVVTLRAASADRLLEPKRMPASVRSPAALSPQAGSGRS